MLYKNTKSRVRRSAGVRKEIPIKVGVHQLSVLPPPPTQLITAMDAITRHIHKSAPWTLLYADDAFLATPIRQESQNDVHTWKVELQQYSLKPIIKKTEYMNRVLKWAVCEG